MICFGKSCIFSRSSYKEKQGIVTPIELGKDVKFPEETKVMHILGRSIPESKYKFQLVKTEHYMKIKPTPLKHRYIIEPTVFRHRRGCCSEKYRTQNCENRS